MVRSMQIAIMKKDLRGLVYNKRLFPVLLIVPVVFTVLLPSLFILMVQLLPEDSANLQQLIDMLASAELTGNIRQFLTEFIINQIIPVFFLIIPIMAASVMSASSFVGEKEKKTLETFLYCPLTLKQIFQAKILASFFLSMLVCFSSFLVMLVVVQIEMYLLSGGFAAFGMNWIITILLIAPSVSLIAITIIVRGSAKAQSMEESQQRSVFLILPIFLLVVGQFTGVLMISGFMLLALGMVFAMIGAALLKGSVGKFQYETLLR